MSPLRFWWKPFVGLVFYIVYPSIAIFKKVGYLPLILYITMAFCLLLAFLWVMSRVKTFFKPLSCLFVLSVLFVSLFVAYRVIHPLIDTDGFRLAGINFGSSDGDDAIDLSISECVAGRYPYYAKTFLDNPITPMPGALLLAVPFFCLGDSALQNLFWLAVFFAAIAVYHRSTCMAAILAFIVFGLSPNVIYQVLQGGDYISNSIYVFTFCALLLESVRLRAPFWQSVLWAALLGLGLSSRLNFVIILPLVLSNLIRAGSARTAWTLSGMILASFCAITLPFFLYDPAGFSPLHTANKLSVWGTFSWAPILIPLIAGALAIVLAICRKGYALPVFARDVAATQLVVMLGGLLLASCKMGRLNLEYAHFGMLFLFFGVFGFGPATVIDSRVLASASQAASDEEG